KQFSNSLNLRLARFDTTEWGGEKKKKREKKGCATEDQNKNIGPSHQKKQIFIVQVNFRLCNFAEENKCWCSEMIYLTLSYVISSDKYIVL
uniref:Uncharacterized protein n=1 Tax=Apteryx owenii TaxID=8824 RepID=A0A8B9P7N2_APTOW